jgi:erythromycin esterase-like protein
VRGGSGDPRRLLRALQAPESQRIATRETIALVEAMREWNAAHRDKQIGFYGFEIPTARSAIDYITMLPDSVIGAPLKSFLTQKYACVRMNEGAHWGLEGRTSDSTFWNACAPATAQATDSVVALHQRAPASQASQLAFAEQLARLIQHHVAVGLRHVSRHDGLAEHVMFLLDQLGSGGRLVLWGGDVEMARLTLDKTTVQTAVPLSQKLGASYRAIGFTVGDGIVRARTPSANARPGELPGIGDARLLPPSTGSYEDVFIRANPGAYWLDLRATGQDKAGAWLKGPHPIRLISETYVAANQTAMETPVGFPAALDGVVFVKHATPARPQ